MQRSDEDKERDMSVRDGVLAKVLVSNIRMLQVGSARPVLQFKVAAPVVDASGAVAGFLEFDEWVSATIDVVPVEPCGSVPFVPDQSP